LCSCGAAGVGQRRDAPAAADGETQIKASLPEAACGGSGRDVFNYKKLKNINRILRKPIDKTGNLWDALTSHKNSQEG
jgi:hypothetical protein